MLKRLLLLLTLFVLAGQVLYAQVTTSRMSGIVRSGTSEPLIGATVTATHQPTGTVYRTQTKTDGKFDIGNMNPGGPYSLVVSYVNFATLTRDDIFLTLGETSRQDFQLSNATTELTTVVVTGRRAANRGGVETNISRDRIANLPTVGRNITDLLRTVPQAKLDRRNEGAIAIAGQNNRFNAFYIDGALNNDVFGLSASGTSGGQANIPPISIDALEQIQVSVSPYDASLSGFTGGGINAVTRSGTNTIQGSAYHLFRNEKLSGKTPTGPKEAATRFADFSDRTYGLSVGGPIIKNKLFFFANGEIVRFERPQVFDITKYAGATNLAGIEALANTLRTKFGYDPGTFLDNPELVEANRLLAKIDWNINAKHKIAVTYRLNDGSRFNTSSSSASTINFNNNGHVFPSTNNTFTGELRSNFNKGISNRLLVTYSNVKDDRGPIGNPFPRVAINDGSGGRIIFGPDNSSTVNLLQQKNWNILDAISFSTGKHRFSVGTESELNYAYNAFIQNTFGNYTYGSVADFLNDAKPVSYQVGYSQLENRTDETTSAAAEFRTLRLGFFANDELRPNERLTLNFGIRADYFQFLTEPKTDPFTNDVAIPKWSQYHDLRGARSGQKPNIPVAVSPRFGLTYRIPDENITIRAGAGMYTGRIPTVWPGGIYNNNGLNQAGFSANSSQNTNALNTIRFRSDPFGQYRASDVGITTSKGALNLIAKEFKLPKVFRTSIGFDKQLGEGWTTTVEGIFTKNINEINYTNIGLLPPAEVSKGPGARSVYPASNLIPINSNGVGSPYDNVILMHNLDDQDKGFSYNLTFTIDKRFQRGFSLNANYSYGESFVVHEQTSSVNFSQWQFVESVNGRNDLPRSQSDFSPGHRIVVFGSKKFSYLNNRTATTVSLVYTGESGAPFSYVYGSATPIRDVANSTTSNDLIYVPTAADLQNMTFLTNGNFTPQQQKDALESFIQNNKYLSSRRGQFAERNGDRMPFTNIIDFRLAQDVNVKVGAKKIQFQVTYDIFNLTNFIDRDWGRTYFLSNDQIAAIQFAGYTSNTDLTPRYRFTTNLQQPQSVQNVSTSSAPSFSPRWTSQVGLRVNF